MTHEDAWPLDTEVPGKLAVHVDGDGVITLRMDAPDGVYEIRLTRDSARMLASDLAAALYKTHDGSKLQ